MRTHLRVHGTEMKSIAAFTVKTQPRFEIENRVGSCGHAAYLDLRKINFSAN